MVQLRESIEWSEQDGVKIYLPQTAINVSDAKEFVSNERFETALKSKSPQRALFDDILSKSDFIQPFRRWQISLICATARPSSNLARPMAGLA
jgi:hypothetical protein